MFRLAYRKFADGHEAVVGNYTVSAGGVAGIRWFELRNVTTAPVTSSKRAPISLTRPGAGWAAPRWTTGNLALGFSASSATINPQIRYAGRLVYRSHSTLSRRAKPLSSCWHGQPNRHGQPLGRLQCADRRSGGRPTFWYTQEYYATTGTFNWRTRIGSFKFSTVPTNAISPGRFRGYLGRREWRSRSG